MRWDEMEIIEMRWMTGDESGTVYLVRWENWWNEMMKVGDMGVGRGVVIGQM